MRAQGVMAVALLAGCLGAAPAARAQASDTDKQFLEVASEADFAEITMSELAQARATDAQVKAFAGRMLADHRTLEASMKPFADAWGLSPATAMNATHQAEFDGLKTLQGAAFDAAYARAMVTDHHAALEAFRSELKLTHAAEFRARVAGGERVVAQHTEMADRLRARLR